MVRVTQFLQMEASIQRRRKGEEKEQEMFLQPVFGSFDRVALAIIGLVVLVTFVVELPDLRRYIKMKSM
jgi:hypothetical protein